MKSPCYKDPIDYQNRLDDMKYEMQDVNQVMSSIFKESLLKKKDRKLVKSASSKFSLPKKILAAFDPDDIDCNTDILERNINRKMKKVNEHLYQPVIFKSGEIKIASQNGHDRIYVRMLKNNYGTYDEVNYSSKRRQNIPDLKFQPKNHFNAFKDILFKKETDKSNGFMRRNSYSKMSVDGKNRIFKDNSNRKSVNIFENTEAFNKGLQTKNKIDPIKNYQESKFKIFGINTRTDATILKKLKNKELNDYY